METRSECRDVVAGQAPFPAALGHGLSLARYPEALSDGCGSRHLLRRWAGSGPAGRDELSRPKAICVDRGSGEPGIIHRTVSGYRKPDPSRATAHPRAFDGRSSRARKALHPSGFSSPPERLHAEVRSLRGDPCPVCVRRGCQSALPDEFPRKSRETRALRLQVSGPVGVAPSSRQGSQPLADARAASPGREGRGAEAPRPILGNWKDLRRRQKSMRKPSSQRKGWAQAVGWPYAVFSTFPL